MNRIGRKPAPEGWADIEPTLRELDRRMRDGMGCIPPRVYWTSCLVENASHEGKRIDESLWLVFQIHHQRSRYIYELFYKRKAISRELYEYCLNERIADKELIAKWRKPGYENLCCLRCINQKDTNFGTNCICRVPKEQLEEGKLVECKHCGCRGCGG